MENLPMKVSISRVESNVEDDYISIVIKDSLSSNIFARLKMSMNEYAFAISGLACCESSGEVINLENIGKKMEQKQLVVTLPINDINYEERKKIAVMCANSQCPIGWVVTDSFCSQNTFYSEGIKNYARCTIRRWVEPTEQDFKDVKKDY